MAVGPADQRVNSGYLGDLHLHNSAFHEAKTGNSVDVDRSSSQKITPSRESDTDAETLIGDELEVARL